MSHNKEKKDRPGGLEGLYANHYRVGYNAFEFVIEFGQLYEGENNAHFHTRIITNPNYAKELLKILSESLDNYESVYGVVTGEQ